MGRSRDSGVALCPVTETRVRKKKLPSRLSLRPPLTPEGRGLSAAFQSQAVTILRNNPMTSPRAGHQPFLAGSGLPADHAACAGGGAAVRLG